MLEAIKRLEIRLAYEMFVQLTSSLNTLLIFQKGSLLRFGAPPQTV